MLTRRSTTQSDITCFMSLSVDDRLVCIPEGHLQSDINQVSYLYNNSPDDGHMVARNM